MQPALDASVVPAPASAAAAPGSWFTLDRSARILAPPGSAEAGRVAAQLAAILRRSTGYPLPLGAAGEAAGGSISLQLDAGGLGDEGYRLEVTPAAVRLAAGRPEGLFRGVQTLRQLLPPRVEAATIQPGPWRIPGGRIVDRPRYPWRGAALDVARHFFGVEEVKRYLDHLALYKLNVLHLHLTDDQGWRIAVDRWPRLASIGGSTQVGGGPGGCYSRRDYAEIVAHARERHITVVPEIDVPGHTTAALASYPELACDGRPRPVYTGTEVGFSALCPDKPLTWRFLDEVLGELAEQTPGPFLHVGGDEVRTLDERAYAGFVERVQQIVRRHGKQAVGWEEIARARLLEGTVVQYWNTRARPDAVLQAARRGARLLLSPASRTYLDMKYDPATRLGLDWAGGVEVADAYRWDPAGLLEGVGDAVLGVEAPLWSETLRSLADAELMAFPRLPAVAEVAWSPESGRDWDGFRRRLAAQGPRWEALGLGWYRSPQVPWPA
jgi:hexosaminidase